MADHAKVVWIDEFKARRNQAPDGDGRTAGGDDTGALAAGTRVDPRRLTPHEISHRFAMLAFLRKAR